MESWRQGLKAVAIYRDNSKGTQPLNVTAQTDADKKGTRGTNVIGSVAAGSIEIEEAVIAAKAAAAQVQLEAQAKIAALETQLRHIAEAALKNSDSADAQARLALSVTVCRQREPA